jgi:hypothetical protein
MLKAVQNFLTPVSNQFTKPHAAVDGNKQGAFVQTSRVGVSYNQGIEQLVPNLYDFRIALASIQAHLGNNPGQHRAGWHCPQGPCFFKWLEVDSTPLHQGALARAFTTWTERRDESGWEAKHFGIRKCTSGFGGSTFV